MKSSAGYSGTPLIRKLGIKPGYSVAFIAAPPGYRKLLGSLPDDVQVRATVGRRTDLVHLFTTSRAELARRLRQYLASLPPAGIIWVSWPKKASGVPTGITEDTIRAVALPMGLVDVKVCAVDDTWSGLKLVRRLENR